MYRLTRKIATSLLFLFISSNLLASGLKIDTLSIQQNLKKMSASYKKDAELIGSYMDINFTDEASRAYAISYWLATNINFDYDGFIIRRPEQTTSSLLLDSKKALSSEYALLFSEICNFAKLKSAIIEGYTKDFDFLPTDTLFRAEHTWSAVQINNQWHIIDLSRAAGNFVDKGVDMQVNDSVFYSTPYYAKCKFVKQFNSQWVFADPSMVIYKQYPIVRDFQLLENPVSLATFKLGESAIRKHLKINSDTIGNSEELTLFANKNKAEQFQYVGDSGTKENKFNAHLKGMNYLHALEALHAEKYDADKDIISGTKPELKKIKRYATLADSSLKVSLLNNDLEYRQIQKRSENWKANLKVYNKMYIDSLKNRVRVNNYNLKLINTMYQKGMAITQHLNQKKAQFISKNLDAVKRPKIDDPTMNRESKLLMRQQDSLRKVALGVLFQLENVNRAYSQEKVMATADTEKSALKLITSNIDALQNLAKNNKTTLSMVHIPTTNVEKLWLRNDIRKADSINKANIDPMLSTLAANQLKFYDNIKLYTGYLKERLNLLKLAKKGSFVDQKEDSLFNLAVSNFSENLLSYHYELKTYTITRDYLKSNLEDENKKMLQLIEKLQKESDMENLRHKSYLEYRKIIKDAENMRCKLAMKRIIKLNTLLDKSMLSAKSK